MEVRPLAAFARMLHNAVPTGPYFGFTKPELDAELIRYKAEVKKRGSSLTSASVNGQSFQFGARRDGSLEEWQIALQEALAFFGAADCPPPTSVPVSFR